jgi:hypothetical protein
MSFSLGMNYAVSNSLCLNSSLLSVNQIWSNNMQCTTEASSTDGTDHAEGSLGHRYFDHSAVAWLVGEAMRHLHGEGKDAELYYQRTIELLSKQKEATDVIQQLAQQVAHEETGIRWSLLHVLGDVGHANAAGFLVESALAHLPDHDPQQGCQSVRDEHVLVATMAVEALQRSANGNPEVADGLLKIVSARPERRVLVEAVTAAVALGLGERLVEVLPKEDHWMIDIRRSRVEELHADPEREDTKERSFQPPKSRELLTSPQICCCQPPRD